MDITPDSVTFWDVNGTQSMKLYTNVGGVGMIEIGESAPYGVPYLYGSKDGILLIEGPQIQQIAMTTSGQIEFNMDLVPYSAALKSLGTATLYWNDVSYKTLSDRGCLGSFDEGVEMQDGSVVSDLEALKSIKVRDDKETVYGIPMLDYRTMPKAVYKPAADEKGKLYKRDKNDDPLPIKVKKQKYNRKENKTTEVTEELLPADGAEMTALFSIMIGAIKELGKEVEELKKK
jgi:hypothetical protein